MAIENKNKGDDIQWIVYWVLYTFFSLIETFQDFILYWIPFYFAFKLALLLWAMLPQTRGAKFLYDNFLKDFLKKKSGGDVQSRLDAAVAEAKMVRTFSLTTSTATSTSSSSTKRVIWAVLDV